MNVTRESIFVALADKLRKIEGVVTFSRRLAHWSDVDAQKQPAIYQSEGTQVPEQRRGMPTKWSLNALLHVYVQDTNPESVPATALNDILDKVESALAPDVNGFQTLGGLCSHCWISGPIETDEGTLGDQAVAIIPIEILVSP